MFSYDEEFMDDQMLNLVDWCWAQLEIPFDKEVIFQFENLKKEKLNGYCDCSSMDYFITINSELNRKDTMITIAHELVHVKQSVYGEPLSEVEAYGRESILYNTFINLTR